MKKGVLVLFLSILLFRLIIAENDYTLDNVDISDLSEQGIEELVDRYDISQEQIEEYISQENFQIENIDLSQISCEIIKDFITPEIVGTKIPEQVPISNEIIVLYIDEIHIGNIIIEESVIKDFSCSEEKNTYSLYVTKKFMLEASNIKDAEISDIIDFYKENKKSGDIKIKSNGFVRNIKLFILNVGISVAKLFL